MTLPVYSTGTVSVAAGGTVVTGTGGIWTGTNVKQGDFISIAGSTEVLITEVTDGTHLKITPWPGAAQSGAAYVIYQNYVGRVVGVAAAEDVGIMLEKLHTDGLPFIIGTDETVPDPSYGDEGQLAFKPSTGEWWEKTGGVWVPSLSLSSDATKVFRTGDIMTGPLQIKPSGAVSATTFVPRQFSVLDGNITGGQVTTRKTPTAVFSRNENITDDGTSDGSDGPALYSVVTTSGTQQAIANSALAYAYPASSCDVVGVYGAASQNGTAGTHSAFGGFFYGATNTAGSGALGIQAQIQNDTGVDKAYNPATQLTGSPFMVGIDIVYSSTGGKLGQAANLIRAGTGKWDVGIALINGVNSADIRTDTTSVTILLAGATAHTNGVDLSAATFSGAAYKSPGFAVDGVGNIINAGAYTQTTPTITAASGAFGAVSATLREKKIGKTVHCSITVTVTNVGTAATIIFVSLPTSSPYAVAGAFADISNGSLTGTVMIPAGGSTAYIVPTSGIAAHTYLATLVYESI